MGGATTKKRSYVIWIFPAFINCSLDYAEMELNVTKTPWTKLEFKEKNDL